MLLHADWYGIVPGAVGDADVAVFYMTALPVSIYLGDLDQWSFTATQGDYIALSMGEVAPVSAGFPPPVRPVSPTRVLLRDGIGGPGGPIALNPPTTRAHTLVVGGHHRFCPRNNTRRHPL